MSNKNNISRLCIKVWSSDLVLSNSEIRDNTRKSLTTFLLLLKFVLVCLLLFFFPYFSWFYIK